MLKSAYSQTLFPVKSAFFLEMPILRRLDQEQLFGILKEECSCISIQMKNLKVLNICNTDINEVDITKLPNSLEEIKYSADKRSDCQLVSIIPQLDT